MTGSGQARLPTSDRSAAPAETGIDATIARLRAGLLDGYGPGASQTKITAMTRDRAVIAGQPTVVGLEQQAQQIRRVRTTGQPLAERLMRRGRQGLAVIGTALLLVLSLGNLAHRGAGARARGVLARHDASHGRARRAEHSSSRA